MRRFFIDKSNITKEGLVITGKEAHHIRDVIRLKPDDSFIGFDKDGFQYICRIKNINKDKVKAVIERKQKSSLKMQDVTLACAIPKLSRMDYIVQKATELGVKNLIPMQTDRTEVKLNEQRAKSKISHWKRIAIESSKQCGRDQILKVSEIKKFGEVIKNSNRYKTKLIPCIFDKTRPIKGVLSKLQSDAVLILIGPEGDFTSSEIELAINAGFIPVSLGPLVLRVDTAAIFALSLVMSEIF
ncbi:MAG: 16S rRNA (uracil(1498)-N(3))-methyltransferase [Candidatus Omnitrophota bacterium]|nr:MAG: 16S rRNA (uracil(1498)-N(3))-methyltransferase [Candidatus Omnitrophota bacterium]